MRHFLSLGLVLSWVPASSGCRSVPDLKALEVVPSAVVYPVDPQQIMTVTGHDLVARWQVNYQQPEKSGLDVRFEAALLRGGERFVLALELVEKNTLRGPLAHALPLGSYDLWLRDPRGRQITASGALLVTPATLDASADGLADLPRDLSTGDAHDAAHDLADAGPLDGSHGDADGAAACPAACSNGCLGGVCELDCSSGSCSCPAGQACTVDCTHPGSCGGTVDCSTASSCNVDCRTTGCGNILCGASCNVTCRDNGCTGDIVCASGDCTISCRDNGCRDITCGTGRCDVTCSNQACKGTIDCRDACACSVDCGGHDCDSVLCPAACAAGCTAAGSCTPGCP